jgi:hypothetical protein
MTESEGVKSYNYKMETNGGASQDHNDLRDIEHYRHEII